MNADAVDRVDNTRRIRAPRGPTLSAKSWQTEAPLRMLMNNLDAEVAEKPEELIVYGGTGRAARNWACYDRIVAALMVLEEDETLLVQSGKPVGVLRTHADAPRVLIANSNLVAHWASLEHFGELDRKGLMMYGQMTAGSWIYIGSQGILQGTYETFVEAGRHHYGGDLGGRWILTAGLGGMGGAQPLAATMAGASVLAIECRASQIDRRIESGYLDRATSDLDEALGLIENACSRRETVSVGLVGNAAEVYPELVRRGARPDLVTDQTAAHDPLHGYLPLGWSLDEWEARQAEEPEAVIAAAKDSMAIQVRAILEFHRQDIPCVDYGNNLRQMAPRCERRGCLRLSRLRAGLYPADVLPRQRPVPLGRPDRRDGGHLPHRRQGQGGGAGRSSPPPLARHGPGTHPLSRTAGTHLLARTRRARSGGTRLQRDGGAQRAERAGGDRSRPSRLRLGREPQPRNRKHVRRL